MKKVFAALCIAGLFGGTAQALDVHQGDFTIKDFHFRDGETLPELRLHYRTIGTPRRDAKGRVTNAVMVLHGTGGSGAQFLRPQFADALYGPGQPLDVTKYYVILPDDIGHGNSSKPSDGLRAKFPHYGYQDMVEGERRLLVEGLKVDHLRLMMGTSMGCMHNFMWAEEHPDFSDAYMPLACLPIQIAGLNRSWRKMLMDAITMDPAYEGGDYKTEPVQGLNMAADILMIAGSAPILMQKDMSTRDEADAALEKRRAAIVAELDANDFLYQVAASRDYDPSKDLEKITAPVMWVNSQDDFINPPYLGIAEKMVKRIKHGTFVLIPASEKTHGHGTHTWGDVWKPQLIQLLQTSGGPVK